MKKITVFLVVLLFTTALSAQTPKLEVFGGYAFTSVDTKDLGIGRQSFNGWDADVAARISKNISIVGDISGAYKTQTVDLGGVVPVGTAPASAPNPRVVITSVDAKFRMYNYLFGPRFSFSKGKVTPFVHALFGLGHTTIGGEAAGTSVNLVSSNGYAMAIGGGLDVNASKHLAIRVAKFDYLLNHVSYNNPSLSLDVSENLNNIRIATGVVFKF